MERSARNPRRIKRLINGFGLERSLNPVWSRFEPEAVIRTLLVQHLYADFYRVLVAADGAPVHAAREFLAYRVARRVLSQWVEADEEAWRITVDSVTGHGLAAPDRADPDDWEAVLRRLEENLPTSYPALARDQDFVRLVEEWMRLPEADELVDMLRNGGAVPVARRVDEGEPQQAADSGAGSGTGRGDTGSEDLRDLRVLWVDDNPGNNTVYIQYLQARGAEVVLARNGTAADEVLGSLPVDLLISDVARGTDTEAGLTDLARWRGTGAFEGPALFFTGRVTPARLRRCQELRARITNDDAVLQRGIAEAVAEIRHRVA